MSESQDDDVSRVVDALLRQVHGHEQPARTARFDADAFQRGLDAHRLNLPARLRRRCVSGSTTLLTLDLGEAPDVVGHLVGCLKPPVAVVTVAGDMLFPGEAGEVLTPLTAGMTLLLLDDAGTWISNWLLAMWDGFAAGRMEDPIAREGMWLRRKNMDSSPGALVVVQSPERADVHRFIDHLERAEDGLAQLRQSTPGQPTSTAVVGQRLAGARRPFVSHEEAYREMRRVEAALAGAVGSAAAKVVTSLATAVDDLDKLYEFWSCDVELGREQFELFAGDLMRLGTHCANRPGGRRPEDPLPDVYAAALRLRDMTWKPSPEHLQLFRGQRNHLWQTVPSYYRSDDPDRGKRLRRLVQLLGDKHAGLTDQQLFAIAQHVSSEARTPTWFIDVTWDPLIGLFFASDGGVAGEFGVVDRIDVKEWERQVAREGMPGAIETIEVREDVVARVSGQRGLFLNGPDPDSYERYVPFRLYFVQHDGLVFTDLKAEVPISRSLMYPVEPWLDELIARLATEPVDHLAPLTPPELRPTDTRFGAAILSSPDAQELTEPHRRTLSAVADVLGAPERWLDPRTGESVLKHSFARLEDPF